MLNKIHDYINESQKRKNIFVFSLFACLSVANILSGLIPTIRNVSVSGSYIPLWLQLVSYLALAIHISICVFCRIKHYSNILRGIFFYQLPAIVFFITELGLRIGGSDIANGAVLGMFDIWTVFSRTFAYLITPFIGMGEIYTKVIIQGIMIFITASAYSGIKKSIAFKAKIAEKHEMEAKSAEKN